VGGGGVGAWESTGVSRDNHYAPERRQGDKAVDWANQAIIWGWMDSGEQRTAVS
jgi:hypothetical protein